MAFQMYGFTQQNKKTFLSHSNAPLLNKPTNLFNTLNKRTLDPMSSAEETPSYSTRGRGIYNDIVDSTSSQVGKLLFTNFEVRSSETMRDSLRLISSLIETKVQQIGAGLGDIAPQYQEYLSNAWDRKTNRRSQIVTLNSLVYCDVVLGLFEQFSCLARRNQLKGSGLSSVNAIEQHFTPLLSLAIYILVAVAMETDDDISVRQRFDWLPLDKSITPPTDDGCRPLELPPLLSWINGTLGNDRTKGVPKEGTFVEAPDLDLNYNVRWSYIVALLTGYHQRSGRPNRCFTSGHPYFSVPKLPDLVEMLAQITTAKALNQRRFLAEETATLYKKTMSPWNKFASPVVLAEAYGQSVFKKLKAMASEGFLDHLACVKVPDSFQEDPNLCANWPEKPIVKMWKFQPEDGTPFYLIVVQNVFSPRFHQYREYCADRRPVIPAEGGSKGGFISVSVRGAREANDLRTYDDEVKETYFPVGSGNGRAVHCYGACPEIQPDDDDLFKITDLIYSTCDEAVAEYLEENSKDAKRFPTGKANIISTFYASANNIGQGSHSDFNLTIARENTESFDDVPLPTREELFTLTYVAVQSKHVDNQSTHTYYKYTCGGKTLSPVKNEPNCENGPVEITGNSGALQCLGSQFIAQHDVQSRFHMSVIPTGVSRWASTCRTQSMPEAVMQKLKGHSAYRFLPPSFEERMAKWKANYAGFVVERHSDYRTYEDCGNFSALVSADPRAAESGSHMNPFARRQRFASLPNTECEDRVDGRPAAPPQLTDAWNKVSIDRLLPAPDPFAYDKDITRQEFFVDSDFPASIGMLHHTVVRNVLLRHDTNVKFKCLPPGLCGEDSSDSEISQHQHISPQLYMPKENCFAKPGEIFCKKAVSLAAGMPDKPGARSHPITSCLPHKTPIVNLRNPYKSTPSLKRMVMNSLAMRVKRWRDLSTSRLNDDGSTYGSGGSGLPAGSSGCEVVDLALDVHNIEASLTLTLGQLLCNEINVQLQNWMRLGFPISLFVTLGEFFSREELKEIYVLLQQVAEKEGDQRLGDWDEFFSTASDRVLFVDYIFLKEVSLTAGEDPTQREDLSGKNGVTENSEREDPSGEDRSSGGGVTENSEREDSSGEDRSGGGPDRSQNGEGTKLDSECIVSPGTESDFEKHGVLVDFKNNFHHVIVMSRLFSPAETEKLCLISESRMKEVVVDKDDPTLFKIPVSFCTANSINRRRATYSVHNMRRYLFMEGYRRYIVHQSGFDAATTDDDSDDDNDVGTFNHVREQNPERSAVPATINNGDDTEGNGESNGDSVGATENQKAQAEDQTKDREDLPEIVGQGISLKQAIREVIFSCAMTVQAGCLRALGKSVVRQMVISSNNNRITSSLAASTLSASHIIDACRLHPMPMAARYLDIGPLCSIAHSISFGGMKATKDFSFDLPPVPLPPKFIRTPVDESSLQSLISDDRATLITNACIMRFTGRPNYLIGYAQLDAAEGDPQTVASVLAGLLLASSPADRERFIQFIKAISKTNKHNQEIIGHLFSKAHLGQIPTFLYQSLLNLLQALENGIFPIGKAFLENYHRIINEVRMEPSYKEGEKSYFHEVQKRVFQWMVSYLHQKCDGNGRTQRKDWYFLAQSLLLDIRGALLFPSLETHYLKASATGLSLSGNKKDDPNLECSNPGTISMGNGSSAVLKLLRKRTNRPRLKMDEAFVMTLDVLRGMSDCELLTVGLVPFESENRRVLIDALTGQVWCRLGFEHWLCKHYLVLKHKFPQNSSSKKPEIHKKYLHPCVWGSSRTDLKILDWDNHVPEFLGLARQIVGVVALIVPECTEVVYPKFDRASYQAYAISCRRAENERKMFHPDGFLDSLKGDHKQVIIKNRRSRTWSLARQESNGEWTCVSSAGEGARALDVPMEDSGGGGSTLEDGKESESEEEDIDESEEEDSDREDGKESESEEEDIDESEEEDSDREEGTDGSDSESEEGTNGSVGTDEMDNTDRSDDSIPEDSARKVSNARTNRDAKEALFSSDSSDSSSESSFFASTGNPPTSISTKRNRVIRDSSDEHDVDSSWEGDPPKGKRFKTKPT